MARTTASRRLTARPWLYSNYFDGFSDSWNLGNNYAYERNQSFSSFGFAKCVKLDTAETSQILLRKGNFATGQGWGADMMDGSAEFRGLVANNGANRIDKRTVDKFQVNKWYFWAMTYDGSSTAAGLKLILIEVGNPLTDFSATTTITDALSSTIVSTDVLRIGSLQTETAQEWNGEQTAIGLANTALTLAELQDFYYDGKLPASTQSFWLGPNTDGQGSTLTDEVGSVDGTLDGSVIDRWKFGLFEPRFAARRLSTSAIFSATSDNISWADDAALDTTNLTSEVWVKFDSASQMFASKYGASGQRSWYMNRATATGLLSFGVIIDGGNVVSLPTNYMIPFGQWFHTVLTHDGSVAIAYVNGREVGRVAAVGSIDNTTSAVRLGRSVNTADSFFGEISLFRMWGVAATRAQVVDLYFNNKVFATPIIEALFTEGNGTDIVSTGSYTGVGTMTSVDWGRTGNASPRLANRNFPNSLIFNNVADYLELPSNAALDVTTAMTQECWLIMDRAPTIQGDIMNKWHNAITADQSFIVTHGSTGLLVAIVKIGGANYATPTTGTSALLMNPGLYHIVQVFDGAFNILYVNGRELSRVAAVGSIQTNNTALRLGSRSSTSSSVFGRQSLYRLWGVAATPAQVMDLYISGKTFATPIVEYLFSEGAGATVASSGSYVADATISGAEWTPSAPFKTRSEV